MMQEIVLKTREFIESHLNELDEGVTFADSDNIFDRGYVNSLFAMKLIHFVETEFAVSLESDDIEIANFSSVDSIVRLVQRKRSHS
jgi:acyl carrier protein